MMPAPDRDEVTSAQPGERPRRGRPRADQAGKVEARILEVATALFLDQGFGRTTLDQVAETAHVGKTTLYSRFATKDALFAAIVQRYAAELQGRMSAVRANGSTEERLRQAGLELAKLTLTVDSINLMRLTLAEASAFPQVAEVGFRIGFGGCVQSLMAAMAEDDSNAAQAAMRPIATRFVEMALHPLYFHAFAGAALDGLQARAVEDVAEVAAYLCRAPTTNADPTERRR